MDVETPPVPDKAPEPPRRPALNPHHSRWLMGFPREWDDCAPGKLPPLPKKKKP